MKCSTSYGACPLCQAKHFLLQWQPFQSLVVDRFTTVTTAHQSSPSCATSPLQGNGFGSQVRVIDLHGGPLLGTISEHCVKMVCWAPYCVTKSSEGDTMMKTGKEKGTLGITFRDCCCFWLMQCIPLCLKLKLWLKHYNAALRCCVQTKKGQSSPGTIMACMVHAALCTFPQHHFHQCNSIVVPHSPLTHSLGASIFNRSTLHSLMKSLWLVPLNHDFFKPPS